jgi:hypothetical protein
MLIWKQVTLINIITKKLENALSYNYVRSTRFRMDI